MADTQNADAPLDKNAPKSIYETGAQYRARIGKDTEEDKAEAPAANPAETKKPAAPAKGR